MMATATAVSPHESASAAAAAAGHHHPYQEAMPMPMPATAPPPAGGAAPERKVELFASVAFLVLGQSMRGGSGLARIVPALAPVLAAAAPVLSSAPSLLAMLGIYRVAQRPLLRAGEAVADAMRGWRTAQVLLGQVGKEAQAAASVTAELAAWRLPALPGLAPRAAYA